MACRLVLQLPTPDLRHARIVAATDDPKTIHAFAHRMLEGAQERADAATDPFDRELAYLEKEQLAARLAYALRVDGITLNGDGVQRGRA